MNLFAKTWTKAHWPLDDLWPHICWGHMCDSTQGSLCPSPMGIHQCMWIQWSILQITTYIHILHTTYIHTYTYYILHTYINIHTTYRISDHIVSFWTMFRRDKKGIFLESLIQKGILPEKRTSVITPCPNVNKTKGHCILEKDIYYIVAPCPIQKGHVYSSRRTILLWFCKVN